MSRDTEVLHAFGADERREPSIAATQARSKSQVSSRGTSQGVNEEMLRVAQQIFLLQTQEPPRVVVFAGIDPGDGCSEICSSVAELLAKNARRPVCLVDANFRSPSLSQHYKASNQPGLTDALLQEGPMNSFARPVDRDNLWLLSSGALAFDSPNLFSADNVRERFSELRQDFDFVLIDAPPLSCYSDALVLGRHSEGVVLVLQADSTRRESASTVVERLREAHVPILAAVLNKRTYPIPEAIYKRL